ncbi:Hypothetical protein Tcol_941 [Trichococcus collinsii]|uniref:Uncharacterized protein n=1 Tax=Trichococcus collinsii TaxID=157076 RepID=A0AB38A1F7_9LACT|nr:Hypothetical protein Tcol_941 [Trichococcus collinsii]SEA49441.1 hypothetical protein SAMN04488525_103245 [Trichococcus collinsii]
MDNRLFQKRISDREASTQRPIGDGSTKKSAPKSERSRAHRLDHIAKKHPCKVEAQGGSSVYPRVFYNRLCKLSKVRLSLHCKLKCFLATTAAPAADTGKGIPPAKYRLFYLSLFYTISLCRKSSDNSAVCITENDFF